MACGRRRELVLMVNLWEGGVFKGRCPPPVQWVLRGGVTHTAQQRGWMSPAADIKVILGDLHLGGECTGLWGGGGVEWVCSDACHCLRGGGGRPNRCFQPHRVASRHTPPEVVVP